MKRVTIVNHDISRDGGTEKYWFHLVRGLADHFEIDVFGSKIDESLKDKVRFHDAFTINRPSLLRYLVSLFSSSLARCFLKIFGGYKTCLVHCSGPDVLSPDICTAHVCQRARYEAIISAPLLKTASFSERLRKLHFSLLLIFTAALEKHVYSKSTTKKVICVSPKVSEELIKHYGLKKENTIVIPNGIDTSLFNTALRDAHRQTSRDGLGYDAQDYVAVFASSDWERKGLTTLFKAVNALKDSKIRLLIVGHGAKDLDFYEKAAVDLGIEKIVKFIPFTRELHKYFAASDILIHPSYYDSFGLAPLEAMGMGIPVIISKQCGLSHWISNGTNGFILNDPSDHIELASIIGRISHDKNKAKNMSIQCADLAGRFSWERVIDETKKIYDKVLSEKEVRK